MSTDLNIAFTRYPIDATFELTVRCNMKCKMCMFRQNSTESRELTAKDWIKIASEAAEMGTGSLLITGSEPMSDLIFPKYTRVFTSKDLSLLFIPMQHLLTKVSCSFSANIRRTK